MDPSVRHDVDTYSFTTGKYFPRKSMQRKLAINRSLAGGWLLFVVTWYLYEFQEEAHVRETDHRLRNSFLTVLIYVSWCRVVVGPLGNKTTGTSEREGANKGSMEKEKSSHI